MIGKFLFWLFDSENDDLNTLCRRQLKLLNDDPSVQRFFSMLKERDLDRETKRDINQ